MDELLRSQILIDEIGRAIAENNDDRALEHFEEYKKIYEKITGKKLQKTFEELINVRKQKITEQETENER